MRLTCRISRSKSCVCWRMPPILWRYTRRLECVRMYVYVILCVRVCMYMCVCFMYLNLCTHKYIHFWISASWFWVCWRIARTVWRFICVVLCVCMCMCMYVCVHVYVYACVCIFYVSTHVRTHMNLKIKILCLLTKYSNFMKVYMSSSVCVYVCIRHLVCVRARVYMFYVFEFVYA